MHPSATNNQHAWGLRQLEAVGRVPTLSAVPSRVGKADAVRVSGRGATPPRFAITDAASTNIFL
jgi:hypothetical protein